MVEQGDREEMAEPGAKVEAAGAVASGGTVERVVPGYRAATDMLVDKGGRAAWEAWEEMVGTGEQVLMGRTEPMGVEGGMAWLSSGEPRW